jgi:hypothetical protein
MKWRQQHHMPKRLEPDPNIHMRFSRKLAGILFVDDEGVLKAKEEPQP